MNLDVRMKKYEHVSRAFLTRRMPVIIRIDGKAFHTFTQGFDKPFDEVLCECMKETAKFLCENIQNCKIAYTQSDEISLLLIDYDKLDTESWFNNNKQKMASVSASMATLAFNKVFDEITSIKLAKGEISEEEYEKKYMDKRYKALFDSRVFNIPREEVCNYFLWRQQDATRNSIEALGRAHFSHSQLNKVNCNQIQDKLFIEKGINWNDLHTSNKRGCCVVKESLSIGELERSHWVIDNEIPIFSKDRDYIEKYLYVDQFVQRYI